MPKVLITNGTNPWTWYYSKMGQLFDVADIRNSHYFVRGINNDGPAGVHIRDGELLYTEAEYNEIRGRLDKAIDDMAMHAQELMDLRHERTMLLETIEKAAGEQQLVELPQDVADAFKSTADLEHVIRIIAADQPSKTDRQRVLREYAKTHPHDFVSALFIGYAIEQTPEERLQEKVEDLIQEWLFSHSSGDIAQEAKELAGRIIEHAKQLT